MTASAPNAKFTKPFHGERTIPLKAVCRLKEIFVEPPGYQKVTRWVNQGVYGVKLEAHREGRAIYTSIEAVVRFIEKGNNRGDQ